LAKSSVYDSLVIRRAELEVKVYSNFFGYLSGLAIQLTSGCSERFASLEDPVSHGVVTGKLGYH